ncbi:MAG TPA: hypothetical protein VFU15_15945, partial [Bacteroidia bacterium]|nr:hypothetical protein [Bacteroidia bacterium]
MRTRAWVFLLFLFTGAGVFFGIRAFWTGLAVTDFHALTNYRDHANTITVDLSDAVYRGIEIPTVRQLPGGKFVFSFNVKNSNFSKRKFYYKIYYQDDSYKFPEYSEAGGMKYENRLSSRNFYGSWGETEESFRP